VLTAVLLVDLLIIGRRPHERLLRESTLWVVFYVLLALAFGLGIFFVTGPRYAGEFIAGWLTEYSVSVDNLFVFVTIMARFALPRAYQQSVLLVGIVLALIMRGIFIAAGAVSRGCCNARFGHPDPKPFVDNARTVGPSRGGRVAGSGVRGVAAGLGVRRARYGPAPPASRVLRIALRATACGRP
jgi:hypothetical protein